MKKYKVGIIGCGNISDIYIQNMQQVYQISEVYACADVDLSRAKACAEKYNIPKFGTPDEIINDENVEVILNITPPKFHFKTIKKALLAGKHVYTEKPLALNVDEGRALEELAEEKGLRLGCAPDTVLGGGYQTARKLIDDGEIGTPIAVSAFFGTRGPEWWHPNPMVLYQKGAGPLFDMGPYYITAMITLLGGIKRVYANGKIAIPERHYTSEFTDNGVLKPEVPTMIMSNIEFESGIIGNFTCTFDVWSSSLPFMEIQGTDGTIKMPDPNQFGGSVFLRRKGEDEWTEIEPMFKYHDNSRGLGICDMMHAIDEDRPHRTSAALAVHVLEVLQKMDESISTGEAYVIESKAQKPAPMKIDEII